MTYSYKEIADRLRWNIFLDLSVSFGDDPSDYAAEIDMKINRMTNLEFINAMIEAESDLRPDDDERY